MFLKGEFSNRLLQVSLFAGIVYYITAYPVVFESARKYFPIKFKKTHHLLIFHTFVFGLLMYFLTFFVFYPIVRVVEGAVNDQTKAQDTEVVQEPKWYYYDQILQLTDDIDKKFPAGFGRSFKEINCKKIGDMCALARDCGIPNAGDNNLRYICESDAVEGVNKKQLSNICSCYDYESS